MKLSRNMKKLRKAATLVAALGLVSILVVRVENRTVLAATIDQSKPDARRGSEAAKGNASEAGEAVYATNCAICHGENREGILPGFPPLAGIQHQMTGAQIITLIRSGKGRMPAFPAISSREMATLLKYLATTPAGQMAVPGEPNQAKHKGLELSPQAAAGGALFQQNCAFCHGRDAMGGETGPDLTRSKLVLTDSTGANIAHVVGEGRVDGDKRMPAFRFSSSEVAGLVAFIRARVTAAQAMKGGRRGVDVSDLQTGNAQAGKKYFNGAGGCAKCHSPTGDLAGVARRYEGLQLEERMLYPRNAKSTVSVTLADGQTVKGTLAYHDEFTIALMDHGTYRSWPTDDVKYTIDSPVEAHVELFSRYTDDDIHNLMAYIQTLR